MQAYEIFVVESREEKEALADAALGQTSISDAPVVLVFAANPRRSAAKYGERGTELYCIQDATIAAAYTQLAATALGLGSVWIGAFDEEEMRRAIGVPQGLRPVAIIPIGYPARKPGRTPRRSLEDLVHWEKKRGWKTP